MTAGLGPVQRLEGELRGEAQNQEDEDRKRQPMHGPQSSGFPRGANPKTSAAGTRKDCLKSPGPGAQWSAVDPEKHPKPSFETALERLESIVDSMEQGQIPLAELLGKYEEGTKLLRVCEARLKEAELKIEKLKKQKDGSPALEPFEPARSGE